MVKVVLFIFVSLFLISCTTTQTVSQEIQEPPRPLSAISCSENSLSFTITNTHSTIWSLDRTVTTEEGYKNIRIFLNGKIVNPSRDNPVFYSTEEGRLFGGFLSDNCGEEFLLPGKSVDCTLNPVVFEEENTLWMEQEGIVDRRSFSC